MIRTRFGDGSILTLLRSFMTLLSPLKFVQPAAKDADSCAQGRVSHLAATMRSVRNRQERMSISKTRSLFYRIARVLGDVQAVRRGRVGKRVSRRLVGRSTGRALRKLLR